MDWSAIGSGLGGMFGGMFGNSGKPYDKAMDEYKKWADKAAGAQQPYAQAGQGAIKDYQEWLQGQKDPSKFINNLQGQYQASPYSQYLQNQSILGAQNAGSASGMTGSTPMMQQMQQNAAGIASGDMNQWLQNVLGINSQYGQGQNNLMTGGQNAANQLSSIYSNMGNNAAQMAYGSQAGKNQDFWNTIGGAAGGIAGMFL